MKKFIAVFLVLSMMLTLGACGAKQESPEEVQGNNQEEVTENTEFEFKVGTIDDIFDVEAVNAHVAEKHSDNNMPAPAESPVYANLNAALLALEKGEIVSFTLNSTAAEYIAAHNDKFAADNLAWLKQAEKSNKFSMLTTEENTELHSILDGAIKELKANGTLDRLIAEDLTAYITSDPAPVALPQFEGANTYKIAVTGDLPPMDFVSSDGIPAGFNVALLSEIANIAQVNFELVHVDSGARLTALAADKVDAVFWTISYICQACGESLGAAPEGTLITEDYFADYNAAVMLKENIPE